MLLAVRLDLVHHTAVVQDDLVHLVLLLQGEEAVLHRHQRLLGRRWFGVLELDEVVQAGLRRRLVVLQFVLFDVANGQ